MHKEDTPDCRRCRWCEADVYLGREWDHCTYPPFQVDLKPYHYRPTLKMRGNEDFCGMEGKYYEHLGIIGRIKRWLRS